MVFIKTWATIIVNMYPENNLNSGEIYTTGCNQELSPVFVLVVFIQLYFIINHLQKLL